MLASWVLPKPESQDLPHGSLPGLQLASLSLSLHTVSVLFVFYSLKDITRTEVEPALLTLSLPLSN